MTAAEQALADLKLNLAGIQKRIEKLRNSTRTHDSHLQHAEGMADGVQLAIDIVALRLKS